MLGRLILVVSGVVVIAAGAAAQDQGAVRCDTIEYRELVNDLAAERVFVIRRGHDGVFGYVRLPRTENGIPSFVRFEDMSPVTRTNYVHTVEDCRTRIDRGEPGILSVRVGRDRTFSSGTNGAYPGGSQSACFCGTRQ